MLPAPAQHPAPSFSHFTLNAAKRSPSPTPAPQIALKGAGGVIITCPHLVPSPIYSPRQFSALPPPAVSRGPSLLFQGGWPLHSRPPAAPSPPLLPLITSSLLPIGSFGVLVPTHRTESLEVPRESHLRVSLGTTGFVLCLHWSPLLLPLRDFSPCFRPSWLWAQPEGILPGSSAGVRCSHHPSEHRRPCYLIIGLGLARSE